MVASRVLSPAPKCTATSPYEAVWVVFEHRVVFIVVRGFVPLIPITSFNMVLQLALAKSVCVDSQVLTLTIMPLTTIQFIQRGSEFLVTLNAHFFMKRRTIIVRFRSVHRAVLYEKFVAYQPGYLLRLRAHGEENRL